MKPADDPTIDYKVLVQRGYDLCADAYDEARRTEAHPELALLTSRLGDGATVLDVGLAPHQLPMFEGMLRRLTLEEMEGVDEAVKGLPTNMGADLSVIPAGSLMSLTGASVDERLTFDENSYTKRKSEDKRRGSDESGGWLYVGGDGGGDGE